jgi:hypothetical protein
MSQAETDAQARVSARTYAFSAVKFSVAFGFVEWGLPSLIVIQLAVPAERGCYCSTIATAARRTNHNVQHTQNKLTRKHCHNYWLHQTQPAYSFTLLAIAHAVSHV